MSNTLTLITALLASSQIILCNASPIQHLQIEDNNNIKRVTDVTTKPVWQTAHSQWASRSFTGFFSGFLNPGQRRSARANPDLATNEYVSQEERATPAAPNGKRFKYKKVTLAAHNVHRANHSAQALTWSTDLAATAAKIAGSCVYAHNVAMDGGGYGQNIAAGLTEAKIATVISNLFYNNELPKFGNQYGVPNPTGFATWGHFSQVVWNKTSQVGCYTQDCSGKGLANVGGNVPPYFTVCNYKSPGNVAGQYGVQIGRPLGHPTVTGADM